MKIKGSSPRTQEETKRSPSVVCAFAWQHSHISSTKAQNRGGRSGGGGVVEFFVVVVVFNFVMIDSVD